MGDPLPSLKIIANPVSGGGRAEVLLPTFRDALEETGFQVQYFLTRRKGDAELEASRRSASRILVFGGDGTINEVINGLKDHPVPFTAIPLGTANLLAREFHLPKKVENVVGMLLEDRILPIDVCAAEKRRFLMVAGIGFDAEVTRRMKSVREGTISMLSYIGPILRTLLDYGPPSLEVLIDNKQVAKNASSVVIGNIRNYGGFFSITSRADPCDGLLDVCVFKGRNRRSLLRYGIAAFLKRVPSLKDAEYYRGKSLKVFSPKPEPVQLDGDFFGTTPFSCEIIPEAASLIVPKDWAAPPAL